MIAKWVRNKSAKPEKVDPFRFIYSFDQHKQSLKNITIKFSMIYLRKINAK